MRTRKPVLMALLALVAVFAFMVPARADSDDQGEKRGLKLNVSCPDGPLVIDVKHRVVNDGDSGVTRYWAYDSYKKHIRVWQTGPTTLCAVVQYEGSFTSTAGPSPMGTDSDGIAAGITGSMTGGYRATITGALNPSPAFKVKGNLGTFDYGWTGDPDNGSPNPFRWTEIYFLSGYVFNFDWWGWVYNAAGNVIWFNTDGNAGDITD